MPALEATDLRCAEEARLLSQLSDRPVGAITELELEPLAAPERARVAPVVAQLCLLFGITSAVLISAAPGARPNAAVITTPERVQMIFSAGWLATLDDRDLHSVIGHELGHVVAHHSGSPFGRIKRACGRSTESIARRFECATELTADRFGMIAAAACGIEVDDAAAQLGVLASTGRGGGSQLTSYLDAAIVRMDRLLRTRLPAAGTSHPEPHLRTYAAWMFGRSDLFRSITGRGPSSLSIAEVDNRLARLLPRADEVAYHIDGVDVLATPAWLERRWAERESEPFGGIRGAARDTIARATGRVIGWLG